MKKRLVRNGLLIAIAMIATVPAAAQDKVEAEVGADLVSGYIWRGQDLGNVSIQPSLSLAYKGFSLSAWGSAGFEKSDTKELDLTLGYGIGGFSVSVTDYWFNGGPGYFHYGAHDTNHTFEAQVGYDFGALALNWYTNFAGNVGYKANGERAYASYFSIEAPFTPWENDFYNGGKNGFAVSEVGIKTTKELKITGSWTLPVFAQAIWNPATEGAYFVAGLSF